MFKYSSIYINAVSFFISLSIFLIINLFFSNYENFSRKSSLKTEFIVNNSIQETITQEDKNKEKATEDTIKETKEELNKNNNKWHLEIPKIDLNAEIREGTTDDIMENYIGHFEETAKDNGNVGLAAHNRGYKNNYFQNLKELKEGDIIIYYYNGDKKEYKVTKHVIIKDTDWSNLEDTKDNKITLITCVENQPEYRRCIQGEEIKKGEEE